MCKIIKTISVAIFFYYLFMYTDTDFYLDAWAFLYLTPSRSLPRFLPYSLTAYLPSRMWGLQHWITISSGLFNSKRSDLNGIEKQHRNATLDDCECKGKKERELIISDRQNHIYGFDHNKDSILLLRHSSSFSPSLTLSHCIYQTN